MRSKRQILLCSGLTSLVVLSSLATPAAAHHAMGGKLPTTFAEGLLSGLAHPVLGLDHLAFVIAIGMAAALVPAGVGLIGAFFAASAAGILVHVGAWNLPLTEVLAAATVIVAGGMVAFGNRAGNTAWLAVVAVAGLVHGYALGESIVGADRSVLGAYLIGLAITAACVSIVVMSLTRTYLSAGEAASRRLRTIGAALGSVGVIMLAINLAA
jgi:urease accessory protein